MSDKVVGSFQQRRLLVQAFDALGDTRTEAELTAAARDLVQGFPHAPVLGELLKRLDTPSSQLRGGLGYVAALLPPDDVVPALRKAVADRRNQPQVRITATLLLERFLGQSPPQALISDLEESNEVAFQSLREAIEESAENRHILLEYVTQMRETESAVAFMVIEMLGRIDPVARVELLRLIAQDDRRPVAQAALAALEELGSDENAAAAVARTLHVLQFSLTPDLVGTAERSLRKLRFGGIAYQPPQPETDPAGWGALLSPADPGGNQTVWLVNYASAEQAYAAVVGAIVNPRAGIIQLSADETVLPGFIMPPHAVGELVPVSTGADAPAVMLQVPFDYGRWLIRQGQEAHWQGTALTAYPDELKLYGDLIWQFAAPAVEKDVLAIWQPGALPADGGADEVEMLDAAEALIDHAAMGRWVHGNPLLLNLVELAEQQPAALPPELIARRLLQILAEWPGHAQMLDAFEVGLRGQAAWLHYRGEMESRDRALKLAGSMTQTPITQNPFLTTMLTRALNDAARNA